MSSNKIVLQCYFLCCFDEFSGVQKYKLDFKEKMREMTHCCCCVPLPDGVMLVGVYGTAFHTGLLVIQVSFKLILFNTITSV